MYCTHCTHGSSALERRQGELAARMLGYSVRASSLEGDALRQAYRQVERYVSYHLPKDTPGELKLQLTATTAPTRLIFVPSAGSWQIIGQVCYRGRDTEGRPGSYFAHLLCRQTDSEGEPWTLLDALQLWQAPNWVTEDSTDHPFVLPTLEGLDSMRGGRSPRIDDRTVLAFLRGDDRSFGSRLPDRWRDFVPTKRVETLQNALSALLNVGTTRRQTLLVAVEPEVAALLFYAIGRLLPPGGLRASVSMSTFEAAADRLTTILAATTFSNPATAEFRADVLRGRGAVLNTFASATDDPASDSAYAENMIRCFREEGPEVVDRRLAMIAASRPERVEALEGVAETEDAVGRLFQAARENVKLPWRSDPVLTDFARRLVCERLESLEGTESFLSGLCGRENHTIILDLAGKTPPGSGIDRAFRYLLGKLPEEKIVPFVSNSEIDDGWKAELLLARSGSKGRTPKGCEWIWDGNGQETPLESTRRSEIAARVMAKLPGQAVVPLLTGLNAERRLVATERLLDACDQSTERWGVFAEVVRRLDVASLIALWQKLGTRLFEVPASAGEAVTYRLRDILATLHEHSVEFSERLMFLEAGQRWLNESSDRSRMTAWLRCRDAIVELIGMRESSGWNQLTATRRLEAAAQRMTEAAIEAMPAEALDDDRQGNAKQKFLRAIGRQLGEGNEFLPTSQWQYEALWKKVGWRIEMGSWPSAPLRKLARGPADRQRIWIAAAVATVVLAGVLGIIALATTGTDAGASQGLVVERADSLETSEAEPTSGVSLATGPPEKDALSDGALSTQLLSDGDERTAEDPDAPDPVVFRRTPPEEGASERQEAPSDPVPSEQPIVPVQGTFAANMTPVAELKPPSVALIGLQVRGVDGKTLPDWLLAHYTIGAVVQEQNDVRAARYIDFPDLAAEDEAELFDGVQKVLVQFRFVRKATSPAMEPDGITATSYSWAEVPIEPAHRYDIRFALAPSAITELKRLGEVEK